MAAYSEAVERILGLPRGSFEVIDDSTLHACLRLNTVTPKRSSIDGGHHAREADQVLRARTGASSRSTSRSSRARSSASSGPNGAGKTTTIRTLLDLIRPTSRQRPRLRHRDLGRPGRDPPPDRLPARRVRPLRPARPAARRSSTSPTCAAASTAPTRRRSSSASTSTRARRFREYSQGQQAEGRPGRRPPAPARAARPRRADVRPRPARPADVLRRAARDRRRAARPSSSRATSCPRSRRAATGSRSSARAGWSRSTRVEALRDLAHHQVELRFAGPVPAAAFEALCRASATSSPRTTSCGCASPGRSRRSSRPRRATSCSTSSQREPSLEETFLAQYGREAAEVNEPWPLAPARRPAAPPSRRSRSAAASTASGASTARRSATRGSPSSSPPACSAGSSLVMGAAIGDASSRRPQSRLEVEQAHREHARVDGQPVRQATLMGAKLGTLGGYMSWKYGAMFALGTALWSILALSGTLAGEAGRGSLDFVAAAPFGKRRIALEKLAAHLTMLWLAMALRGGHDRRQLERLRRRRPRRPDPARGRRSASRSGSASSRMFFGGLAFALAPLLGRAGSAGVAGLVMVVLWVVSGLDVGGPLVSLSPFHWTVNHIPLVGFYDWAGLVARRRRRRSSSSRSASSCSAAATSASRPASRCPACPAASSGSADRSSRAFGEQLPAGARLGPRPRPDGRPPRVAGRPVRQPDRDATRASSRSSRRSSPASTSARPAAGSSCTSQLLYIAAGFAAATFVSKWASDETDGRLEKVLTSAAGARPLGGRRRDRGDRSRSS